MRVLSRYLRIKPPAFEYDRTKRFGSTKLEFVYFFKYPIIVLAISSGRHNSGICGPSMRLTLLVACCVKAIPIDVINVTWHDPKVEAIGNLPQFGTYRRIPVALQSQARALCYSHKRPTWNQETRGKLDGTFFWNQEMKSRSLRMVSTSWGRGRLDWRQNRLTNSLCRQETWRGWMQNSDGVSNKFVENLLDIRRHFI